ncbi:MAG: collagen-like protein, partial [Eudoraea sp.]|nr:collagen-like protein [Eudoraea sp.]
PKGDTGPQGIQGETGAEGPMGPQGPAGVIPDLTASLASQNLNFNNGNVGIGTATPTSNLHIVGSIAAPIRITTTNTTLDGSDYSLIMKAKNLTINLPVASTCPGRIYILKNISTGNNRTGTKYICNRGFLQNSVNKNKAIWLQSDGTHWQQINIQ